MLADTIEVAVEQRAEEATGGLPHLPVRVVGERSGGTKHPGRVVLVTAGEQEARHLSSGWRGRCGEQVDPPADPTALLGQRGGEPLANLLAERGRTSRASVVQLAVERGNDAIRVIPGKGRQDGGEWALLHRSEVVELGPYRRRHVFSRKASSQVPTTTR